MNQYISTLRLLSVPLNFDELNSMRNKLALGGNNRPDIACDVAKIRLVTKNTFAEVNVTMMVNEAIRLLKKYKVNLKYLKLDANSVYIRTMPNGIMVRRRN